MPRSLTGICHIDWHWPVLPALPALPQWRHCPAMQNQTMMLVMQESVSDAYSLVGVGDESAVIDFPDIVV